MSNILGDAGKFSKAAAEASEELRDKAMAKQALLQAQRAAKRVKRDSEPQKRKPKAKKQRKPKAAP